MTARSFFSHAPAKINLFLHVTGKRDDGYHLLESLAVFSEHGDIITVENAPNNSLSLTIDGPFASALSATPPEDNLILKTAHRLRNIAENPALGAHIRLTKNLPVGAGIGGGSSDAAAAARLLCTAWNIALPTAELATLLAPLGADIPLCVYGCTSLVRGIGEQITPLPIAWRNSAILLVNPGIPVATQRVFQRGFAEYAPPLNDIPHAAAAEEQWYEWLARQQNMLTENAIEIAPEIADIITALAAQAGCQFARMSGSGATCFGLFTSLEAAKSAASHITHRAPGWWQMVSRLAS